MQEYTVKRAIDAIIAGLCIVIIVLVAAAAFGATPECTGDRHYDGVACCPPAESCPDPAPCQTVTCECAYEGGTTNYITVNRCPDVPACPASSPCAAFVTPRYQVCKVRRNGTLRCPHPRAPRRVLVPVTG